MHARLDALLVLAERARLPEAERPPLQCIYIMGGLPDQQHIGMRVGQFRIYGGLPPLPREPSETQLLHDARQRLVDVLVSRINSLATAGTPI
jgi:hypothetical protein